MGLTLLEKMSICDGFTSRGVKRDLTFPILYLPQTARGIELYTSRDLIFSHSNLYAKVSRISIDPIKFRVDLLVYIY